MLSYAVVACLKHGILQPHRAVDLEGEPLIPAVPDLADSLSAPKVIKRPVGQFSKVEEPEALAGNHNLADPIGSEHLALEDLGCPIIDVVEQVSAVWGY